MFPAIASRLVRSLSGLLPLSALALFAAGAASAQTISDLSPFSAAAGSPAFTLTVNGTGFVSGATVQFNGTALGTTFVSDTQLTASVTASLLTTPENAGVIVVNPGGTTSNTDTFPILAPTISDVSPSSAAAGSPAFTLTVNGTSFISSSTVQFNGTALTTTFVNDTQLTASLTAGLLTTPGTAPVTVVNPGGSTSNAVTFTIPAPTLLDVSPSSAAAGSAAFTLTANGTNFVNGSTVQFSGTALSTTFISDTQVIATVTAGLLTAPGTAAVSVMNPGGSTSSAAPFTIVAPTVSSLTPPSAAAGSAAFALTVNGTSFVSGSTVQFNGTALTTTFVNSTQVTATVAAALVTTAGTAGVTVVNPGGSTSNAATFMIVAPAISNLTPSSAAAGGPAFTLTVNGTNFVNGSTAAGSTVQFNGTALTTTFVSATQLTATVTAGLVTTPGTASVTVVNPGGATSNAAAFTIAPPSISSLNPFSAPAGSLGFTLTVNGTNFVSGATVQFNGTGLTTTFVNATQLTASVTGAMLTTGGSAAITEMNPGGATSNLVTFTIADPSISSLSPISAPAGGPGFTLTVNGANFVSGSTVQFNGTTLSTTFVTPAQLTASVTAGLLTTAGSAAVTVGNPGGDTSSAATFTIAAPAISSLSPAFAPPAGPAFTLTVNGTNFLSGSTVQFNGAALSTTFVSGTQLTASVGAALITTLGTAAITVVNPGGATSNAATFKIAFPPLSITPSPSSISTTTGGPLSVGLSATGGTGSYTFSVSGQPSGVTLVSGSLTGSLTGSPTQAGIFNTTVTVTDSNLTVASASITINVLGLATTTLPSGTTGLFYATTIGAAGGTGTFAFSATGLPAGLSLASTGYLNGTVKTAGIYPIAVTVSSGGLSATTTLNLTIAIPGPLSISSAALPGGTAGVPYSQALDATGGLPPYTWSLITAGTLPQGLSLSPSGIVSGTTATPGSFMFGVRVTDTAGGMATGTASLTIQPAPLTITTLTLPSGMMSIDYPQQQLAAVGGVAPYTWALAAGSSLPIGMVLSSSGIVSGVPGVAGSFSIMVTVTDQAKTQVGATLSLTIRVLSPDLILTSSTLAFALASPAGGTPAPQMVGVQSTVPTTPITYTVSVSPAAPWLALANGTTTPDSITASLTSAALSLSPGSYQTTITATCSSGSCTGHTQTVMVNLTVTVAPPQLLISTGLLSFATTNTALGALTQSINIQNTGGGSLGFASISCEAPWCTVGPPPSGLAGGVSAMIPVTVNPSVLSPGFYRTQVDIPTSGGIGSVPVTLFIAASATLTLAPAGTLFNTPAGSAPGNPSGSFLVNVNSPNPVSFSASVLPGASFLTLQTTTGSASSTEPGTVSFSLNPAAVAALAPGAYYGEIQVTSAQASNSPENFEVVLNVAAANSPVAPDPEPGGLLFITSVGGVLPPQTVTVYSGSGSPLTFQASAASGSGWLSVTPNMGSTSATSPGVTSVSVNTSKLSAGVYLGSVSYSLSATAIRTVNVTLVVTGTGGTGGGSAVPTISSIPATPNAVSHASGCTPSKLVPAQTGLVQSFFAPAGWPTPLQILLFDDCGSPVNNGQLVATFSNGDPPLALPLANPSQALYAGTWSPASPSSQVTINVTASAPNFATATSPLSGAVVPNAVPLLSPNGTLHVFDSLIGGALAPGTIVAIYGQNLASATSTAAAVPLPAAMNGSSVIIGGIQAPLYYVSPGQIDAQIPFELQSSQQYQVIVITNGALTTPQPIQLTPATPGFAANPDSTLIAQHSDGSLVSQMSPARGGEYLVAYLAGLGDTTVPVPSGTASPASPLAQPAVTPTLTINGTQYPIYFAGLTPGLVGLYQLNFQVPTGLAAGNLTVVVSQNNQASNQTVLPYQP